MRKTLVLLGSFALVVTSGIWLARYSGAADATPATVPDTAYPKLAQRSLTTLQNCLKLLAKGKLAKEVSDKLVRKGRVAAVMIAAYAQANLGGAEGHQRATVRDAAIDIAGLMKKEEWEKALEKSQTLLTLTADAKAKKEQVKLFDAHMDIEEVMSQFDTLKAGGQDIEKKLLDLAKKRGKTIPAASLNEDLQLTAYQTAQIAELSKKFVMPAKYMKFTKDWNMYCDDMEKAAQELGRAVDKKDGKTAFAALVRLNTSCTQCHDNIKKKMK